MHGKVIAIHSRIGNPLTANMHVPVDIYKTDWEKLVAGERWGGPPPPKGPPLPPVWLGIIADPEYDGPGAKVGEVVLGSPAEKAGLKVGDLITTISGNTVANFDALRLDIQSRKAGDEVTLDVRRGTQTVRLTAVLDKAQ
jgi:serine protease Do